VKSVCVGVRDVVLSQLADTMIRKLRPVDVPLFASTDSSSCLRPVSLCPGCTSTLDLLYNPKHSIQHRFNNPVPFIKRQKSVTEAVLISFGSTVSLPKTLWRWRSNASQQQIICCNISVSNLQILQVGSPSNRPIIYRCPLTGACPVRIATIIFSWCLLNLSRSSALFLHGLPIKGLPYLWPGKFLQAQFCWCSVQFLIASLAEHWSILRPGSGPSNGIADACLASLSAYSLPRMPRCPGTQIRVNSFRLASTKRASIASKDCFREWALEMWLRSYPG